MAIACRTADPTGTSEPGRARGRRVPFVPLVVVLLVASVLSAVASLAFGTERIPLGEVVAAVTDRVQGNPPGRWDVIVWELRMPRALMSLVVGAGLAVAGAGMQTLVRNPLADPFLLGISSGASVGATATITTGALAGLGIYALSTGALLGAIGASVMVWLVATAQGGLTPIRLVLSGVVLSSGLSAIASFLVFASDDPRAANSVMFWMLGSVGGASWERLWVPAVVGLVVAVGMLAMHRWLDALAAGPETAASLGVNVMALRAGLFVALAVLVGVLVAVSGGIGFVGLIVPHAARLLVGARHRVVLPVAALGGGLFLLWVDVLARLVARPQEIPLGVVTGVVGAPLFLLLMGRSRYRFGGES
ncbi:iron complex transport system permease protein [Nocardioides albertanoniae]|uniref:Iron complex transport system permease protein n=1 Tax=Nocardioides albertanoniae TaxID=1175486 RepID=A0A543A507_9ACTN|nr:iron complex transport system permease protein [Nocardioides albertanoniae]